MRWWCLLLTSVSQALSPSPLKVLFVVDKGGQSTFGATSPTPYPTWNQVACQLLKRLKIFDERITGSVIDQSEGKETDGAVVVALGASRVPDGGLCLLADDTCSESVLSECFVGEKSGSLLSPPWTRSASYRRGLESSLKLLNRKSTEDACFAILLILNLLVAEIPVVSTDINPSWEKGIKRNVQEFKSMIDCCGPEIFQALTDPQTKKAIDLLNSVDLRDQVGSYRVIVSNETPQLEAFSLCILQQNNCFNANAQILTEPKVEPLSRFRSRALDQAASRDILIGHQSPSWRVVCGANPAYDAFPMQHQIFYPSQKGGSLWYDPVFLVETLQGEKVWTKRHYRCVPRDNTPGLWTLTTLDNGIVSKEHWTIVDCADDLEFAVLYYSGAAKNAGQSYQGALLCSQDGKWPKSAIDPASENYKRIQTAFSKCGLELFELYGCGPPTKDRDNSFMWSDDFLEFASHHPPPLDPIGDISITSWRERERGRLLSQT